METTTSKAAGDRLVVLGSGGGRYMATSQRRSTAGFVLLLAAGTVQVHVDPGPGAISAVHARGIDPGKTSVVMLTHHHNDHEMSVPVMIEAMHGKDMRFTRTRGTLIAPAAYLASGLLDRYYHGLLERITGVHVGDSIDVAPGIVARTTRAVHGKIDGNGYIISVDRNDARYRIAFTSDTAPFDGYVDAYRGVDYMVANLLRPGRETCTGHMCAEELVPLLREIRPGTCILAHFGRMMDNDITGNKVPEQVAKIQAAVGPGIEVIGPGDGEVIDLVARTAAGPAP